MFVVVGSLVVPCLVVLCSVVVGFGSVADIFRVEKFWVSIFYFCLLSRVIFGMSFGSIISDMYNGFLFWSKRIISSSTFGWFIFFHNCASFILFFLFW